MDSIHNGDANGTRQTEPSRRNQTDGTGHNGDADGTGQWELGKQNQAQQAAEPSEWFMDTKKK